MIAREKPVTTVAGFSSEDSWRGEVLPAVGGGEGTLIFYLTGLAMIFSSSVILFRKRRNAAVKKITQRGKAGEKIFIPSLDLLINGVSSLSTKKEGGIGQSRKKRNPFLPGLVLSSSSA